MGHPVTTEALGGGCALFSLSCILPDHLKVRLTLKKNPNYEEFKAFDPNIDPYLKTATIVDSQGNTMTSVGEITIAQEKNRLNTPDISKTIQSLNLKIGSLQKMSRENVLKLDGNFIFTRTSSEIHVSENKDGSLTFIARQNQSMHWVVVKDGNLYDDGVKSGQANTEHPSFPNSEYADSYWVIRLK